MQLKFQFIFVTLNGLGAQILQNVKFNAPLTLLHCRRSIDMNIIQDLATLYSALLLLTGESGEVRIMKGNLT